MAQKMTRKRRAALIGDLFHADRDLVALAEAHDLSPGELAAWANVAGNRRTLAGLCVLADMQAQLLLSRYRLLAVSQLAQLAAPQKEEGASINEEVVRKACVDILKLDLKRVDAAPPTPEPAPGAEADADADEVDDAASLRAMLYGKGDVPGDGEARS